jgi:hypothetical protein
MRKFLLGVFIISTFFVYLPVVAAPNINQYTGAVAGQAGYSTDYKDTDLSTAIGRLIKSAISLAGTLFLALTVYAGILWMTAAGNDSKVESAQGILKAAVIGLIIIVTANSITYFVLSATSLAATSDDTKNDSEHCYLGESAAANTDPSKFTDAMYSAGCTAKGIARGVAGGTCGIVDMLSFGSTNLAGYCSQDWGSESEIKSYSDYAAKNNY